MTAESEAAAAERQRIWEFVKELQSATRRFVSLYDVEPCVVPEFTAQEKILGSVLDFLEEEAP